MVLLRAHVARLSAPTDNRSSGLKRWYLVSFPLMTLIAAVPGWMTRGSSRLGALMGGLEGFFFLVFAAFVFIGDALGVSRRTEFHGWQKQSAGWPTP